MNAIKQKKNTDVVEKISTFEFQIVLWQYPITGFVITKFAKFFIPVFFLQISKNHKILWRFI